MNLNKVTLAGRLTKDIELRYTPNNTAVASISLAVNRKWKNKQTGQDEDEVLYADCEAWGKTAEILNQYLKKGRSLFIEGRLKLDKWQDKEGNNRSKIKIIIEQFQFIDSKPEGQQAKQPANDADSERW